MLEGITVLNQEMIMTTPKICAAIILVCIVISIISFCLLLSSSSSISASVCGTITILCIVVLFICGLTEEESGRYRYECTIDESVSIQEVYDKYEIKEQRGEIWVLEDKKKED